MLVANPYAHVHPTSTYDHAISPFFAAQVVPTAFQAKTASLAVAKADRGSESADLLGTQILSIHGRKDCRFALF